MIDYSGSTITVTNHPFAGSYGYSRDEIKFTPNGDIALLTNEFESVTYKIDAATKTIIDSNNNIGSIGLTFDATGDYYFQSNFTDFKINKYQISDMAVVDSFSTSLRPRILYLAPNTLEIYAVYHDESIMEVFDAANYTSIALTALAGNPYYMAFEKSNSTAALADSKTLYDDIRVYPNPSNGIYQLKSERELSSIQVYSHLGNLLSSAPFVAEQIDLSAYPNGIYFIKFITSDSSQEIVRVIKQ